MRFLLPFLFIPAGVPAQTSVLFIGNSYIYSNDLPNMLRQVALSLEAEVTVASSAPGGYQLAQHATYAPTLTAIASQPWDFVVLQEQSQLGALPFEVTDTEIGAIQLVAAIEANNECTYPVFYMTWGRENGDALNCPGFPYMCTYAGMQQGLYDNYLALATDNDGFAAPVGEAWKSVREDHPTMDLYVDDGSHPTLAGTYLAACVLYCTLFNETCVGATYRGGLDLTTATILQTVASSTVLGATATWNMDVPNGTDAYFTGSSSNGPADITYYHTGQGTHLWTCSNGQTNTQANATFTFTDAGTYTFTHTYDDPCGNNDTATWTLDIASVGLEERSMRVFRVVGTGNGELLIDAEAGGRITLYDAQGRLIMERRLKSAQERIPVRSGAYMWTIRMNDGRITSGKCQVP
ncbi:MAG: hypothetical protein JNM62_14125 [Flavobacteriales bacterium]|nr:hypothetical protein [Flavobacteriales bacterium]